MTVLHRLDCVLRPPGKKFSDSTKDFTLYKISGKNWMPPGGGIRTGDQLGILRHL